VTTLILTGFMGTGKTTVGRILARHFGLEFVDTDDVVERQVGCSVADFFARAGESAFRELEAQVFDDAVQDGERIISTGGGTLVNPVNRRRLSPDHTVICLTCKLGAIVERVGHTRARPLFDAGNPGAISTLLTQREDIYSLYPQVDTTHLSPQQVADKIVHLVPLSEAASFDIPQCQKSRILFEEALLTRAGAVMTQHGLVGPVFLLTDTYVAGLPIFQAIRASLRAAGLDVHAHAIPRGEEHKTLQTMDGVYQAAMQAGLDRSSTVVGMGGGVVGDMAGLLAATYLRGLRLVLAPTTLLAQVDAAIGGKVGVDFRGAKNMIGAFKPANLVLIDPSALRTLPVLALADGLVEVIKIGYMVSPALISHLETVTLENVLEHPYIIRAAAGQKVDVVRRDPLERGERMLLNFGHTIGHGLEAASGYRLSHGQAVSIGMVAETRLAVSRGWCSESTFEMLRSMLHRFSLPTKAQNLDRDAVLQFVRQDKKRQAGKIRLAVPRGIGEGVVTEVTLDDVRQALTESETV
jgi:shikimate kinase / 3-dehydroquinate synthase